MRCEVGWKRRAFARLVGGTQVLKGLVLQKEVAKSIGNPLLASYRAILGRRDGSISTVVKVFRSPKNCCASRMTSHVGFGIGIIMGYGGPMPIFSGVITVLRIPTNGREMLLIGTSSAEY